MPGNDPISSNATLHALTERLANHAQALPPLGFPPGDKLSKYRGPAPPPQLPILQLTARHLTSSPTASASTTKPPFPGLGQDFGLLARSAGAPSAAKEVKKPEVTEPPPVCPVGNAYPQRGKHDDARCSRCEEEELDGFIHDMGTVLRREFDCWVEQCWFEAFHSVFTHDVPSLVIQLILLHSSPQFLRKQIVHGGPSVDKLFQRQMLKLLLEEIEQRLSGQRVSEAGPSTSKASPISPLPLAGNAASATQSTLPRDGVCFDSLAIQHSLPAEEDDHGMCLCQLTTCIGCFHKAAQSRRGPTCLLPWEYTNMPRVADGFSGQFETQAQAELRIQSFQGVKSQPKKHLELPHDKGFVRHGKPQANGGTPPKPPVLFQHPQMTDVLAVEEHLRWRLKEMGANDPAVETRYGPSTNDPAALEGVNLPELDKGDGDDDNKSNTGSVDKGGKTKRVVKVQRGKGKVRRVVEKGSGKSKDDNESKVRCYLPSTWTDEKPQARNTAIVLTFRHFVKLLHQVATTVSPYMYRSYADDVRELTQMHPIALYRRLAEPSVSRRKSSIETRAWQECMDKWTEELGAKEKAQGNKYVSMVQYRRAVDYYTRAISLDSKKTVYYSNRAVALNALGEHSRAESDCKHILAKDSKNGKAFFQRALARRGMGRWREAEADLKEALRYQPGNESAKKMLALVKAEVAKLPKQSLEDVMDF